MTSKIEHAATLAAILMEETWAWVKAPPPPPHVAARDALALIKIGNSVAGRALRYCNGEGEQYWQDGLRWAWRWTEAHDALKEKADARDHAKATEIAKRYGATVTIGGDPRGFTMRLMLASGRKNGMGDGWGIA